MPKGSEKSPRPSIPGGPPTSPPPNNDGNGNGNGGSRLNWPLLITLALLFLALWGWQRFDAFENKGTQISYTDFYAQVEKSQVEEVTIQGTRLRGKLKQSTQLDGREITRFTTTLPIQEDEQLMPLLRTKGVKVDVRPNEPGLLEQILPALLLFGPLILLSIWMSRRAQRMMTGGGGPFGNILKGRTRKFDKEKDITVTFDDVAGAAAAKRDLHEIVEFLRDPNRFTRLGGKVPKGVLLVGPPGTGKTLIARAVAGEAGVPFFSINGSEFIEMFVGVGAGRVRELFEEAKKVSPAIIFIDEIDAVGRARGAGLGGGHDEREQTLNQLLSEMDGFSRNDLTIVIAATNRPDVLDPALLRPGRFDRRVTVDRPEMKARVEILQVHLRNKPVSAEVDVKTLAQMTPGFSGADLANLANEAALHAARRGGADIGFEDFRSAYDKIVLGDERETKLDQVEKERVAVHEAGHAIVAHFSERSEPLQRVTIIPRGMALGVTQQVPAADRHIQTQPELESRLRMMMGGYAAESVVFDEVSSGAANDLQKATELAFKMVANFGMSQKVGPVFHDHKSEHPFLGQRIATESGTSDATVHLIEQEIRDILSGSVDGARQLIRQHRDAFDALVAALLEQETIEQEQLIALLGPSTTSQQQAEIPAAVH